MSESGRAIPPTPPGRVLVLSGPSGVGKTSVADALLRRFPDLEWSVSATTRAPRPGEVDGKDYFFLTPEQFQDLILEDAFLEWAEVYGNRYGTLVKPIQEARAAGRDVLMELDIVGALGVRARIPDALLVFLVPSSDDALAERLKGRGTETGEVLSQRLEAGRDEMARQDEFDLVVVNDVLDRAVDEVAAILEALPTVSEESS